MSSDDTAFALVAVYEDPDVARSDVDQIEVLAEHHEVHLHDLAIVRHEEGGHIDLLFRDQRSTLHGAEAGGIAGALAGIMFPPALIAVPLGAGLGASCGAFLGFLWRGLARPDIDALGTAVEEGACAVVAVGTTSAIDAVEAALSHATRVVRRPMTLEVEKLLSAGDH